MYQYHIPVSFIEFSFFTGYLIEKLETEGVDCVYDISLKDGKLALACGEEGIRVYTLY